MTLLNYCWNLFVFSLISISGQFWITFPNFLSILFLLLVQTLIYRTSLFRWTVGIVIAIFSLTIHVNHYNLKVSTLFQAGENITINGRVDSHFKQISHGLGATFLVDSINGQKLAFWQRPKVRILLPATCLVEYGERWVFSTRIKPVYGRLNEAGFDKERYYASQGWAGIAIVKECFREAASHSYRNMLHKRLSDLSDKLDNYALIKALSFGDRNDVTPEMWQQLRSSGLTHLIAISGLHIGIAYFIGWNLGRAFRTIGSFSPVNALHLPVILGLALALCYAWLAGFSITTQRAFTMCLLLSVFNMLRLNYSPWFKLLLTLSLLLLLDPFASMSSSFWLSFFAVSILVVLSTHHLTMSLSKFRLALIVQFALIVLMVPISIASFGGASVYSPFFNLWAVPYFSFFVVPTVFLALLCSIFSHGLSEFVWQLCDLLLQPVVWSIAAAESGWQHLPIDLIWPLFGVIFIWLLSPVLTVRNYLTLCVAYMFYLNSPEKREGWRIDVLDVGQGLAVLIEKNDQHLLYDTGNRWEGGSIAESIIAPILNGRGVEYLDTLILSHLDSDHAGGKSFIEQEFQPQFRISSQLLEGYRPCMKGMTWQWQQLRFEALWPPKIVKRAYNPHSCVIKVSDSTSSILLTGDVELISEYLLVKEEGLEADLMLVPHHGSNTSSSKYFLDSVSPSVAIASLAKGNQWGMPHKKVYQRYQDHGIEWLDTGESGQISIYFDSTGWNIEKMRENQSVTWYRQMLRKGVE
ncbi:DNA internalization-related competence protein ComEC/Rec2 [Vibrio hannami]|nr:DNA internalization-related competence protein ComEC/Rec2 [Vibrio hannami]MDG3088399.1 DNA internalization-related competence protein ComEC/Rec2 [Vibrio hannami]